MNETKFEPYVPAKAKVPEFTLKAVIIGALFGILFGAITVYLGLKVGLTVSASIPIAVLAISLIKKFGHSTILENNIVQTIGSAGESIAAGVVFTIPRVALSIPRQRLFSLFSNLCPGACRGSAGSSVHGPTSSSINCAGTP